ncbi:MAG: hypothetical protein KDC28_03700 [Saprospiraceae bacterium]|nr:hypothetical protein [Saprospiraceae bacterium]MCB9321602.1 hypothetical protein [Lewinellaceae bacterium]
MQKLVLILCWLGLALTGNAQTYGLSVGTYAEGHLGFILNQNNYGYNELRYQLYTLPGGGIRIGYPIDLYHQLEAGIAYHVTGQRYQDVISGRDNEKIVTLSYIQIPVFWRKTLSIIDNWEGNTGQTYWYQTFGLILNALQHAKVRWTANGQEVSMLEFVNPNGENPHSSLLTERGNPDSARELFSFFDVSLGIGGGLDHYFNEELHMTVEMRFQFGLLDVNNRDWRLTNSSGKYGPSHQASIGLQVGLWYDLE